MLPRFATNAPMMCNRCTTLWENTSHPKVMYDARTRRGPWGWLCQSCFNLEGIGLGIGLGQKYELQSDGRWLLTEGDK